jgi:hypothetical protein
LHYIVINSESHRSWKGIVAGDVCFVDVTPHALGDEIPLGTLQSMIRQSTLPTHLYKKIGSSSIASAAPVIDEGFDLVAPSC